MARPMDFPKTVVHWDIHLVCPGIDIECALGYTPSVYWDRHIVCSGIDIECALG